ncbi:Alpha/Beta hydrolase protein [Pestalotiopsis sp. NC0098]|nr:Alpha/Beta hydrolase protein [Pestalotiopsis sp. NC0098]
MAKIGLWRWLRMRLSVYLMRFILGFRMRSVAKRDLLRFGEMKPRRVRIPSRDAGRDIIGDLYYPPGDSTAVTKRPVLVNWHGSGFVIPSLGSDRVFCARFARETGAIVLDADYRKAPENPYPAATNDVEDTLKWIASKPDEFDGARVAVSGFSAGGNLALVAASTFREDLARHGVHITAVAALYPVTDLSIDPESKKVPNPVRPIPPKIAAVWDDCYTPDSTLRADPRVSPSLAEPSLFPNSTTIITCDGDTLSPEANALASRIEETGKVVVHKTLPGMPHGFDKGCAEGSPQEEQREIAYSLVIRTLQAALKP